MADVQEVRCQNLVLRDGEVTPCGWKIAERLPDGRFHTVFRKRFEFRMGFGEIRCPKCGEWMQLPPITLSPTRDLTTKEVVDGR